MPFSAFSVVEGMFAPVLSGCRTFDIELSDACRVYADAVLKLPAMEDWAIAAAEPHTIEEEELWRRRLRFQGPITGGREVRNFSMWKRACSGRYQ